MREGEGYPPSFGVRVLSGHTNRRDSLWLILTWVYECPTFTGKLALETTKDWIGPVPHYSLPHIRDFLKFRKQYGRPNIIIIFFFPQLVLH